MKTLFKSKLAFLVVLAGLSFSCKKNTDATDNGMSVDSTEVTTDSIGPGTDTTSVNSGTTGTTGATGEGSTGSGSAGTTQQGNSNMNTDTTSTTTPR